AGVAVARVQRDQSGRGAELLDVDRALALGPLDDRQRHVLAVEFHAGGGLCLGERGFRAHGVTPRAWERISSANRTAEWRGGIHPPRPLAYVLGVGTSSAFLPRHRPSDRRARAPRRCFRSTSVGPRWKDSRGLDGDEDPLARFGFRDR